MKENADNKLEEKKQCARARAFAFIIQSRIFVFFLSFAHISCWCRKFKIQFLLAMSKKTKSNDILTATTTNWKYVNFVSERIINWRMALEFFFPCFYCFVRDLFVRLSLSCHSKYTRYREIVLHTKPKYNKVFFVDLFCGFSCWNFLHASRYEIHMARCLSLSLSASHS